MCYVVISVQRDQSDNSVVEVLASQSCKNSVRHDNCNFGDTRCFFTMVRSFRKKQFYQPIENIGNQLVADTKVSDKNGKEKKENKIKKEKPMFVTSWRQLQKIVFSQSGKI